MVSSGVVGIQLQGSFEFTVGAGQVRIKEADQAEGGVSFGEFFVKLKGALRGGPGFGKGFRGWHRAVIREDRVSVGQAGVGGRICRVSTDGLLEIVDCLVQTGWVALVPLVAAKKAKFIDLRIDAAGAGHRRPLFCRECKTELLRDVARGVALQVQDVATVAVVILCRQLSMVAGSNR